MSSFFGLSAIVHIVDVLNPPIFQPLLFLAGLPRVLVQRAKGFVFVLIAHMPTTSGPIAHCRSLILSLDTGWKVSREWAARLQLVASLAFVGFGAFDAASSDVSCGRSRGRGGRSNCRARSSTRQDY